MVAKVKKRVDQLILERHSNLSRNFVQSLIMQGKVKVNDKVINKAGTLVSVDCVIALELEEPKFVSRAGFKLEKALEHFAIDVQGAICLDAGLSTGGFTDCLLQRGAKKVYGIDVGYGQVHEKIRTDPRVVVMERTNLRYLPELPEKVNIVTLDLSFISVLKVIETITKLIAPYAKLIVLVKPQFEARKEQVGRGGIIKSDEIHQEVINNVIQGIIPYGFTCHGFTESPILGAEGNKEFLAYFTN